MARNCCGNRVLRRAYHVLDVRLWASYAGTVAVLNVGAPVLAVQGAAYCGMVIAQAIQ
jgi:hypothetical protein